MADIQLKYNFGKMARASFSADAVTQLSAGHIH